MPLVLSCFESLLLKSQCTIDNNYYSLDLYSNAAFTQSTVENNQSGCSSLLYVDFEWGVDHGFLFPHYLKMATSKPVFPIRPTYRNNDDEAIRVMLENKYRTRRTRSHLLGR